MPNIQGCQVIPGGCGGANSYRWECLLKRWGYLLKWKGLRVGANRLDPDSPRAWSGGVRLSMVLFGEEQLGEVGIRPSGDSPLAALPGCGPGCSG